MVETPAAFVFRRRWSQKMWSFVKMSGSSRCVFVGGFFVQFGVTRPSRVPQEESEKPQSSQGQSRPTSRFLALSCFRINDGHFACIFCFFCLCHADVSVGVNVCSFCAFFVSWFFFRSSLQLGWAVPWSFGVGLAARAASSGRSPKHLGEKIRRKNRWDTKGLKKRGFPERLKEREEKDEEPKGDEVARDDRDVGSYGFIWIHMGSMSGRSSNLCMFMRMFCDVFKGLD